MRNKKLIGINLIPGTHNNFLEIASLVLNQTEFLFLKASIAKSETSKLKITQLISLSLFAQG